MLVVIKRHFSLPTALIRVTDPHHIDADLDPDPVFDPDPDPTVHFDANPDPDPRFQIKAQNLEKVLKQLIFIHFGSSSAH